MASDEMRARAEARLRALGIDPNMGVYGHRLLGVVATFCTDEVDRALAEERAKTSVFIDGKGVGVADGKFHHVSIVSGPLASTGMASAGPPVCKHWCGKGEDGQSRRPCAVDITVECFRPAFGDDRGKCFCSMACRDAGRPLNPAPNLSPGPKGDGESKAAVATCDRCGYDQGLPHETKDGACVPSAPFVGVYANVEPSSNTGQFIPPDDRCSCCGKTDGAYLTSDGRWFCGVCRCEGCGLSPPDGNTCLCDYQPRPEEAPPADRDALMADTVDAKRGRCPGCGLIWVNSDINMTCIPCSGQPYVTAPTETIPPNETAGNVPAPATTGPTAAGVPQVDAKGTRNEDTQGQARADSQVAKAGEARDRHHSEITPSDARVTGQAFHGLAVTQRTGVGPGPEAKCSICHERPCSQFCSAQQFPIWTGGRTIEAVLSDKVGPGPEGAPAAPALSPADVAEQYEEMIRAASDVLADRTRERDGFESDYRLRTRQLADLGREFEPLRAERDALRARVAELEADVLRVKRDCASAFDGEVSALQEAEQARARIAELEAEKAAAVLAERERLLSTPEFRSFADGVVLEAMHQRERWGTEHDAGKTDADWFWLIGYLASKALFNPGEADGSDKQLHRIITVAAAAANWHAQKLGQSNMRPGTDAGARSGEAAPK